MLRNYDNKLNSNTSNKCGCCYLIYSLRPIGLNVYLTPFALLKPAATARLSVVGFFSFRWLGRSTGGVSDDLSAWWLLFAVANLCLCLMIVFENKFSAIISQCPQSTIATASLRSPLDCGGRSTLGSGIFFVSVARSFSWWRCGRVVCKLRDSHCCCATTITN